jgi:hypothetical protein
MRPRPGGTAPEAEQLEGAADEYALHRLRCSLALFLVVGPVALWLAGIFHPAGRGKGTERSLRRPLSSYPGEVPNFLPSRSGIIIEE